MLQYFIRGLMVNLETWIEIEENSKYRELYIGYYEMLGRKLRK